VNEDEDEDEGEDDEVDADEDVLPSVPVDLALFDTIVLIVVEAGSVSIQSTFRSDTAPVDPHIALPYLPPDDPKHGGE
jgi:hypothetical protein